MIEGKNQITDLNYPFFLVVQSNQVQEKDYILL